MCDLIFLVLLGIFFFTDWLPAYIIPPKGCDFYGNKISYKESDDYCD